ncbi:hypothetical protein WNY77_20395 [Paraglaciecola mesophila]|uniref:Uncharacterized protein n=2 Tax=Paraglaciecola mesophila TaxID=197222 RepID=K6Y020_9ALTE|nr:hypothetical protein [Paraglaciecola mesophila]GAC26184.1 hypothetical protein GMES_3911 [Paraglaciecola mesophila KMM 241]|tara:strand:- start:838 stop:1326 length:489 start_codon:yes stop_codon:yes gene_type:complete
MDMPNPDKPRSAEEDSQQHVELIKEIIGAATDAGKRYQRQLSLAKTLAGRECKLSARAMVLVLIGVLLLTAVSATLWITLNAMLALGLIQLNVHWVWVGSGVILLNAAVALGIVITIKALLKHVSLSRAWDALTLSSSEAVKDKPDDSKAANKLNTEQHFQH